MGAIAVMAAGKLGGQAGSITKDLAFKALPAAVAMGGGGYVAYQATSAVDEILPAGPEQARERRDATVGAFTPIPAFAAGIAGIGVAVGIARKPVMRIEEAIDADTNKPLRIGRPGRHGWTVGPRLLRAGSLGAIGGAAIAAGLAVPIAQFGASLVGKGTEAATRAILPDWLEGPAADAARTQGEIVDGVVSGVRDVARQLNEGKDPTVVKVEGTYERDPGTPLDPVKELGLDKPLDATIEDRDDWREAAADELIRRFEEAGVEAERVDP